MDASTAVAESKSENTPASTVFFVVGMRDQRPAAACVEGVSRMLLSAGAADAERAVVVDDGSTRSASWAGFTSANAASAAACVEGAPAGLLVGSLLRDASPALFFIVSACEAGTAAR